MRAIGVDYGTRRIGLALSDLRGMLARPWKTVTRAGDPGKAALQLAQEIRALHDDSDGLDVVVIGLPRRLNGEPTQLTAVVETLAARLRELVETPVVLQDERLSSREAESLLAVREKDWRKRKALIDAVAAAVVLQDYLDGRIRDAAADAGHDQRGRDNE
ncbi:MAG: Holliday junction resolvase RuvX [Acidobacteria bacterium]|nr:Holliday junction resolvase RuvX [Acidobacteriota bacterium]